jgi:hypothetical protein
VVAVLHLLHKLDWKKCLWLLYWYWSGGPIILMATPYANFYLWPLDHETSLSSSLTEWVHLLAWLARSSKDVLLTMLDDGYQGPCNILKSLLLWTESHYLWGPTWVCRTYIWYSAETWPLLLTWCLLLALPPFIWWRCWSRRIIIWILPVPWARCPRCWFPRLQRVRRDQ